MLLYASTLLKYLETLEMRSLNMVLEIRLRGEGVLSAVTSSHTGGLLDFGFVLEKETTSQSVQVSESRSMKVNSTSIYT